MPKASSKRQQRWFFAAERRGQLPKGTAKRHARKGKSFKKMPATARAKKGKRR
jgi:hypothetical protein